MARRLSCSCSWFVALILLIGTVSSSHFEGFDADDDSLLEDDDSLPPIHVTTTTTTPLLTPLPKPIPPPSESSDLQPKTSPSSFDLWDEDEFEGLPQEHHQQPEDETPVQPDKVAHNLTGSAQTGKVKGPQSYTIEIVCGSFLIMFAINFFTAKQSCSPSNGSFSSLSTPSSEKRPEYAINKLLRMRFS